MKKLILLMLLQITPAPVWWQQMPVASFVEITKGIHMEIAPELYEAHQPGTVFWVFSKADGEDQLLRALKAIRNLNPDAFDQEFHLRHLAIDTR